MSDFRIFTTRMSDFHNFVDGFLTIRMAPASFPSVLSCGVKHKHEFDVAKDFFS